MPVVTPPKVLAWVPLLAYAAVVTYVMISVPLDPVGFGRYLRGTMDGAVHGHVSLFLILPVVTAMVSIACAVPFILHMAENPAVTRKGPWIVGALLLAPIVLPIYAAKRM